MSQRKRIVVKIGSSLLAHDRRLTLRYAFMNELLADIARLRDEGHDVVLASSGAVALGLNAINTSPEEAGVLDKQAAAACGQPLLLNAYKQVMEEFRPSEPGEEMDFVKAREAMHKALTKLNPTLNFFAPPRRGSETRSSMRRGSAAQKS